jgi:DNA-binding transcriptional LysR family regulator
MKKSSAGTVFLERTRRVLAEVDGAIADAQRSGQSDSNALGIGAGPFSGAVAARLAEALGQERRALRVRIEEEVTPEALRRVGAHELDAAVVMESPAAARRHGVRVDALRDVPLLAALPPAHAYAQAASIPVGVFAAERVLLPREPPGQMFNAWLRTVFGAHGVELEQTMATLSAPWDRRMPPVASGEVVAVIVAEWVGDPSAGFAAVPFDPPLSFPMDLVSRWPATEAVEALVQVARRMRDAEGWLTERAARTEVPGD